MKKHFLLFGLLILLFTACKKTTYNAPKQAAIDDSKIQAYITANHLTMTKDPRGFYYQILRADTGSHPVDTSTVQVTYTGIFLNGTTFDSEKVSNIDLSTAIVGWQYGLPLIGANGSAPYSRIRLIIPSALAYGTTGEPDANVPIPPNAVLDFTIDLIGFY